MNTSESLIQTELRESFEVDHRVEIVRELNEWSTVRLSNPFQSWRFEVD
jgi:hypothetical protein